MTELQINRDIPFKNVLVIDDNGEQLGVMPLKDALFKAQLKGLDVVCVAPKAATPVCKLMDYNKYKFTQIKKEKEAKKNQKQTTIAEIQLTYTIMEHDMKIKAKTCKRLIEEKNAEVRVVLRLRGREVTLSDLAKDKLKHFVELCSEFASVKKDIFDEGRDLKVILERKRDK